MRSICKWKYRLIKNLQATLGFHVLTRQTQQITNTAKTNDIFEGVTATKIPHTHTYYVHRQRMN